MNATDAPNLSTSILLAQYFNLFPSSIFHRSRVSGRTFFAVEIFEASAILKALKSQYDGSNFPSNFSYIKVRYLIVCFWNDTGKMVQKLDGNLLVTSCNSSHPTSCQEVRHKGVSYRIILNLSLHFPGLIKSD